MERLPVQPTFIKGAYTLQQLPDDTGVEVAFAGRSNVGKSSTLNTLAGVKSLARTSKTPGRTQEINFFELGNDRRLVDLPGYGYAKVSETRQHHWAETLGEYLLSRKSLVGLILLMDIRHPLKEFDRNMVHWCTHAGLPVYVILNKADKLSRGKASASLLDVKQKLAKFPIDGIQLFSSLKHTGVDEALQKLCNWLELPYSK
ncbi:putative GTP-binding protein EngB [bacterium BMS3Bbin11]|nr:putative GTP-binding protein EngB [bacterium BMS3Bbin11]HDH09291.1 YihA family ribosome biogenesis GTP-binding protein [Gammaproteobacteria bacterium]